MENNRCPNCGILLREEFRFCPSCGKPLGSGPSEQAFQSQQEASTQTESLPPAQNIPTTTQTTPPISPTPISKQSFASPELDEQRILTRVLPTQPLPPFFVKKDLLSGIKYCIAVSFGLLFRYVLLTDSLISMAQVIDSLRGAFLITITVFLILKFITRSNAYFAEFSFEKASFASVLAGTSIFLGYLPDIASLKKTRLPPLQKGKIAAHTSLGILFASIVFLYLGFAITPNSELISLFLGRNSGPTSVLWISGQVLAAIAFMMTIPAPFTFGNEMAMSNPKIRSLVRIGSFVVLFFGLSSQGQSLLPGIS